MDTTLKHSLLLCIEPNESPGNVSAIAMNATSVIVTWIPPPPEDRNGIIQSFTIRVVGVHTDEDFTRSINATEISIKNLHPFYSYKFTVAAVTVSHGPFSNPITLMMPPLGTLLLLNYLIIIVYIIYLASYL